MLENMLENVGLEWRVGVERLKNRLRGITRMNQGFLKSKFLFLKTFHGLSSSNYKAA